MNSVFPEQFVRLVVQQAYIEESRATQMIQDKAQSAGNGHVLCKDGNAVLDHLGSSLRAPMRRFVACAADLALA